MSAWIAFFDFDGTITSEETFFGSMQLLNPKTLKTLHPQFLDGQVTLRNGVNQIFSEVPSERLEMIERYITKVPLRAGFRELLIYLRCQNIPVVVISGGITQLIDIALAPLRNLITDVYSIHLNVSGEYMHLVSEYDDGVDLMAKQLVMDRYSYENAICIGDGITDLKMAKRSNLIFARDELERSCKREHIPYTIWNDFYDVLESLKKHGLTNSDANCGALAGGE